MADPVEIARLVASGHDADTIAAPSTTPISSSPSSPPWGGDDRQVLADRYEILGLVGAGGMGTVYRARDRELEEIVALKVLRRELVSTPGMLDRFRREVKLARRVTHRNVARVFDIGEHQGEKFLTMEFVAGESLSCLMAREGALSISRVVEIASGICAGLGSAHAAGVVHRDLKPDNVLLAEDGRAVLTDFGIARAFTEGGAAHHTQGLLVGTPAYMAPEQVEGAPEIDARADIYALGAVLFELFTGARAWPGDSAIAVAAARLLAPPPDPRQKRADLPAACSSVVLRAMARRREDRFASVGELMSELGVLTLPAIPLPAPPPPALPASTLAAAITPVDLRAEKTVAVLPFRNVGAPEDGYLAEELTDDLIDSLSMTRGLKVRSRGMVQRFKGTEQDPREIGRELGVQVVVEGSVRRARGNVRISARLISVADGFQLWAKRFDRPEQDVLSINDDAAHAIADALTLDREARAREAPSNPEAVDLYLRARHEYRKFWRESQEKAIELYAQAAALAPDDPMILAGQALSMARMTFFTGAGFAEARAVAERAVAVGPNLGDARLALGSVLFQIGEWKGSVRELRRAIALSPGLAEAHASAGRMLAEVGDLPEAIRRLQAALALDPEVPLAPESLVRAHALRGEWDKAEAALEAMPPTRRGISYWSALARILLWKRDVARATAVLASEARDGSNHPVAVLMLGMIVKKKLPEARVELDHLLNEGTGGLRRRTFFSQMKAELFAYFGENEEVIAALAEVAEDGLIDLCWLDGCPLLDEARKDPRFAAIRAPVKRRADEVLEAYRAG